MRKLLDALRGKHAAQPYQIDNFFDDVRQFLNPNRKISAAEKKAHTDLERLSNRASVYLVKKGLSGTLTSDIYEEIHGMLKMSGVMIDIGAIGVAKMIQEKIEKLIAPPENDNAPIAYTVIPSQPINVPVVSPGPKARRHRKTNYSGVGEQPMTSSDDAT